MARAYSLDLRERLFRRLWLGRAVGKRLASCYAGRMSLVATLAMLMLMPAGIHTGGEECAMSAWSHSEWRLLHAYVPACSRPAGALLSEKRDFKTRDDGTEAASLVSAHSSALVPVAGKSDTPSRQRCTMIRLRSPDRSPSGKRDSSA